MCVCVLVRMFCASSVCVARVSAAGARVCVVHYTRAEALRERETAHPSLMCFDKNYVYYMTNNEMHAGLHTHTNTHIHTHIHTYTHISGELKLRRPGEPTPKQTSVLQVALLLSLFGIGGSVLFSELEIAGPQVNTQTHTNTSCNTPHITYPVRV